VRLRNSQTDQDRQGIEVEAVLGVVARGFSHGIDAREHEPDRDRGHAFLDRVAPGVLLEGIPDVADRVGEKARREVEREEDDEHGGERPSVGHAFVVGGLEPDEPDHRHVGAGSHLPEAVDRGKIVRRDPTMHGHRLVLHLRQDGAAPADRKQGEQAKDVQQLDEFLHLAAPLRGRRRMIANGAMRNSATGSDTW